MLVLLMHVSKVDNCGHHHIHRPSGRSERSDSTITSTLPPASVSLRCVPWLHPAPCLGWQSLGKEVWEEEKTLKPQATSVVGLAREQYKMVI